MAQQRKGFSRADRVREQILRELAEMIRKGLKDPRAGWITLTAVDVTRDYSHAKIFYTVMDEKTREVSQEALESAAGYLRSELGRRISLFNIPQLHFVYDESVERGVSMSNLIDKVAQEDAARRSDEEQDDKE